jgi:hypothetical protein
MKLVLCALLVLFSSMTMFVATAADETAIRATRAQSNRAIQQGNLDAFAASLTADFVMVRAAVRLLRGMPISTHSGRTSRISARFAMNA